MAPAGAKTLHSLPPFTRLGYLQWVDSQKRVVYPDSKVGGDVAARAGGGGENLQMIRRGVSQLD
ncbi:MAG: hypothetical protein ACLPT4_11375 [Verrucomicrobiia bacterium]